MKQKSANDGGRVETFKTLSEMGVQFKSRSLERAVEQAVELAQQGRYLEAAAAFEQSSANPADQATEAAVLAISFYRRALSCRIDSDVTGALQNLERAMQFPCLPLPLRSLFQERATALQRKPDKEFREFETAVANRFEMAPSEVDLRFEFLRKYRLNQANRKWSVDGIDGIAAVGVYRWTGDINRNERWSRLIREFKRGEKGLPAFFGRILAEHVRTTPICREWMREVDYIVPVPASDRRTAERGADIVARTGEHLSTRLGVPIRTDFLRRKANSERSRDVGKTALAAQYTFNLKKAQEVEGRVVLLLDDVMTRGNTASACVSRLKENACARVFLLVLALAESSLQSSRHIPAAS